MKDISIIGCLNTLVLVKHLVQEVHNFFCWKLGG